MLVRDIMTQPVISVGPETTIAEAARLMLQHRISGLPVVDETGAAIGMITEGDLLRRAETGTDRQRPHWIEWLIGPGRLAQDYIDANARKVGETMTAEVVSVTPQDALAEVVERMEKRRVKRLPVIEGGKLVGIVSRANLVRALVVATANPARHETGGTDDEIRDRILAEIGKQPWAPLASVQISVKDGVAELSGAITDDRERTALCVVAENVAGVKAVRDRLVWVEPVSGFVISTGDDKPADGA